MANRSATDDDDAGMQGHLPGNQKALSSPPPLAHRKAPARGSFNSLLHFGWGNIPIVKSTIVCSGPEQE